MTDRDRELLKQLVPHMMHIPARLDGLLTQVLLVWRAYRAENIELTDYVQNLETELSKLEQDVRATAQVTTMIRDLLDEKRMGSLIEVHRIVNEALNGRDGDE